MAEEHNLTLTGDFDGVVNLRVGAIIERDGKFLMAGNGGAGYLYSVGGRLRFGESAEEALLREVYEETGWHLAVESLGFIHENFFIAKDGPYTGRKFYEISFYYFVYVPENFEPKQQGVTEGGRSEFLTWVTADDPRPIYPEFFREELGRPRGETRHFLTREW